MSKTMSACFASRWTGRELVLNILKVDWVSQLDHTPEFWLAVERALPDFKTRKQWLAANGGEYASL